MGNKKSFEQRLERFFAGKGFYIVLFLCIAAIGVSAWIMLFKDDGGDTIEITAPNTAEDSVSAGLFADFEDEPAVSNEPEVTVREKDDTDDTVEETDLTEETVSVPAEQQPETETEETAAEPPEVKGYVWPVVGDIAVEYSVDGLIFNKTMSDWRTHDGIDIQSKIGTKVLSATNGTVEKIYDDDLYGTTVVIDHGDGLKSIYSNLAAKPAVNEGDQVRTGDIIGSVGDTALAETGEVTHLHFAMTLNSEPVDPADYLPKR